MTDKDLEDNFLEGVLDSFQGILPSTETTIPVVDSQDKDIEKMVNDRICGLLEAESLTELQANILVGLLNARY